MTDVSLIFKADTSGLDKASTGLDKVAASGKNVNEQAAKIPQQTKGVGKAFDAIKKNATGLSFQLQDVAVQAQMGTNNLTILAQQGPQIASLFGPVGAIAGTVIGLGAALAGPLMAGLSTVGDEADDLSTRISTLTKELDDLGQSAGEIQLFVVLDQIMTTGEEIGEAEKRLKALNDELDRQVNSEEMISDEAYKKQTKAIQDQQLELDLLNAKYDRANDQSTVIVKQLNKEASERKNATTQIDSQTKASENLLKRLQIQNDTFGMSRAELIRYNGQLAAAEAATADLSFEILAESNALANKTENMEAARIAQAEMDKQAEESARVAEESAREYEKSFNTLSDNITDTIMDFRSLGDVAQSVAEQIKRAFVQNQIVNPLLGAFGMAAPSTSASGGMFSGGGIVSSLLNNFGSSTGLTSFLSPAGLTGPTSLTSLFAGAAPVLPIFGAALSGILGDKDGPRLTFGQGSIGDEFSFTRTDERESGPVSRTNAGTFGANTINTAFGTFGSLGSSRFTQQVDQAVIDGFLALVETIDGQVSSLIDNASVEAIKASLSASFLPENRQFGSIGGKGSPESQLIDRYTQIFGEALPQVFADQLLTETEDFELFTNNAASGLGLLNQASEIFISDITELADAYSNLSMEGESFSEFFTRVNQAAIADLTEFALAIENTFAGIQSLAGLSVSIREQLLTDEQLYDRLRMQADALGESINTLVSPGEIQAAVAEYQQLSSRAFGLLSDEQQQLFGAEIADSIDSVVLAATERANQLIDDQENNRSIEDFANSTQEMANTAANFGTFVQQFGDFVTQATQAAQGMLNASATLRQAAQESSSQNSNIYTGGL